jgi:hypothetical protein
MSFGAKPMGPPPVRPRPQSRGEVAFAVGGRALITPTGTAGQVQLLDEDGMPVDRHLRGDLQVMITAWRPRRSAPPRYRVCSSDQVEGWIDAANLRRLPPPPPPAPLAVTAPPAPPVAPKGAKKGAAKAVAKGVAKPAPVKVEAKAPAAKVIAKPAPKGVPPKPAGKAAAKVPAPAAKVPAAPAKKAAPVRPKPSAKVAAKSKKPAHASKKR